MGYCHELQKIWKEATEYWLNHNLNGVPYEKFIFANDRYCDNEVAYFL